MPKNIYFWPVMKNKVKQIKKTHISETQFDEIFQMVPILMLFEEK